MPSYEDLVAAKKVLSSSLLRAGLQGGVMGMMMSFSTKDAIARASHNVHAVGIGLKWAGGKPTATLCVQIFVVQKLPESMLSPFQLLRKSIEGIETDVIESPPAFASAKKKGAKKSAPKKAAKKSAGKPKSGDELLSFGINSSPVPASSASSATNGLAEVRPVIGGVSAGHFKSTGTLGCLCRSKATGEANDVFVLSNNHVFANANDSQLNDDLYQPGILDGGNLTSSHIAELHRFVRLQMGGTALNSVDAAIGRLLPGIPFEAEIAGIGEISGVTTAVNGMRVCKYGRTSEYSEGNVTSLKYDTLVGMDHNDPSIVARFEDQIRIEPATPFTAFGLPGDSGSVVIGKDSRAAVGLHFAGPDDGSYGVANHMTAVCEELDIDLL